MNLVVVAGYTQTARTTAKAIEKDPNGLLVSNIEVSPSRQLVRGSLTADCLAIRMSTFVLSPLNDFFGSIGGIR